MGAEEIHVNAAAAPLVGTGAALPACQRATRRPGPESSNTTPLPARIYANEGVAQMLFFQADADDICETSYKDRGGK